MRLPHLDQLVPLARGEAGLLAQALAVLVRDVTHATRPVPAVELLTVGPLAALGRALLQRQLREQIDPVLGLGRPRLLRVRYDQLAALRLHHAALFHCGLTEQENLQLVGVVGKFQQKALNLSHWVSFQPPR